MVVVLDANVLAKLFLVEPMSDIAEHVVTSHSLILAPELVQFEVSGAITRSFRRGIISEQDALSHLEKWRRFTALGNIQLTPNNDLQSRAERLSLDLKHPIADCLYLAVAEQHRVSLITADKPFLEAASPQYPNVLHLSTQTN